MNRITQKDLEYLVKRINEATNSPETSYQTTSKGYKANIGNYHLDYAYGGVRLSQMMNEGGGIHVISSGGFGTKRELYNWMQAFLSGMAVKS